MTLSVAIPGPGELKRHRVELGISERDLGACLRLGRNGAELVHRWEESGSDVQPTPLAWAAFRFLVIAVMAYRALGTDSEAQMAIHPLFPEILRDKVDAA